jgi:arginine/lysine/ornithine decarboxylase
VHTLETGLAGIEGYDLLRDEYDIQIEFGDLANCLAYLSAGDRERDIERLMGALSEIRRRYKKSKIGMLAQETVAPRVVAAPQAAFFAAKAPVALAKSAGRVSAEFVMSYPPGIPILAPGEEITPEIIEHSFTQGPAVLLTAQPRTRPLKSLRIL